MKTLVILFAFIGAAFALVPGMQYMYDYEGRLGMGLPEIRNRVAGTGLRARVTVQVQSEEDVVIKLDHVAVGDYLGDVKCNHRQPMPIDYKDIEGEGKLLEEPYKIHIHRDQDNVMLVTKSDIEWITNIRKSIAGLFLIFPLRYAGAEDSRQKEQMPHKVLREPSIFGRCDADYTMVRINDSQRHQERRAPLFIENFALTRTIKFDSCEEAVVLQQTGFGNTSLARENQFGDVSSRLSRLSANLSYDGSRYTLTEAETEGYVIVNPFGLDQDKMIAISNQTLFLRSIEDIHSRINVKEPSKPINTWYQESASPFSRSDSSPLWINFYDNNEDLYQPLVEESIATGIQIDQHLIQSFKKKLDDRLEGAAKILNRIPKPPKDHDISPLDSDLAMLATLMEASFRLARALDQKTAQDLFDQYANESDEKEKLKLRLYIDVLAAAGTGATLRVLTDEAINGKRITPERAASCFFTIPNTLISSPVLQDLERYVKHVTLDKNPFATATVWINYANTLNRVCVNDRRYKFTTPHELFGKKECDVQSRIDSILPFFQDKLEKAKEDWERIILIHAIGNLGSIQAHNHLIHIIQDRSQSDQVRVTAVYSMSRHKLPEGVKSHIFKTLRPIVERRDESPYVRQACIIALMSWKPPPSFFQNLAILTWNEPSNNMASFVYSILRSYAESTDPHVDQQSKVAKFVLPLAKPYAPSFRYSDSRSYSKYTQQDQLATDFDVSWLKRDRLSKSYTEQVLAFLVNSYGGFRFSVAQGSVSYDHKVFSKLLREMSQTLSQQLSKVRSPSNRRAQEDLIDLQNRMNQRRDDQPDLSIAFLSLFDNMELLLPLSTEPLKRAFSQNGAQLLQRLLKDNKFHGTKFMNPGIVSVSLPSEIGLPVFVKTTMPTVSGGEANLRIEADGEEVKDISQLLRAKNIVVKGDSNYIFSTKTITMIRTVMPWSRKAAVVGVEALKGLNLPVHFQLTVSKGSPTKNISIDISPLEDAKDKEITVVHAHTVPFVALKEMWEGEQPKENHYRVVSLLGENEGSIERSKPLNESFTGLKGEFRYEGDVANPFTQGHYIDLIRHPEEIPSLFSSPTSRLVETSVKVDLGKSKTKEIHSSLSFRVDRRPGADEKQQQEEWQQQRTRSSAPAKPKRMPDLEVKAELILSGDERRSYEASASVRHMDSTSNKETVQVNLRQERSSLPRFDPNPNGHCLDVTATGPVIKTLEDLRHTLRQDSVETQYTGRFQAGPHCQTQIASFAGKVRLSNERKKLLRKEADENCNSDPNNPLIYFNTAPVYDECALDIIYEDAQIPREVRNASYHIYDYIRGVNYPYAYFNYMDQRNVDGEITLVGRRYLGESRWEAEVKLPTETSKFDRLFIPRFFDELVPIEGLRQSRTKQDTPSLVLEAQLSKECVITKSQVRAFEGYSFDHQLGYCSVKAVVDKRDREAPAVMVALDRDAEKPKAEIKSENPETSIQITSTSLRVNGQEIILTNELKVIKVEGQYYAEALRIPSYTLVKVPGNFTVKVSDSKITIVPSRNLRQRAGGLCGNLEVEHTEMVDEQNCVYKDSRLFAASWAEREGPECDSQQKRKEQEEVRKYRQQCPKLQEKWGTSVLPKYSSVPEDCIEFVHQIKKTKDGALCLSQDVVPVCYPLCKLDKPNVKEERYSCWSEKNAPKELSRNLKRGYLRHKIHRKPSFSSSLKTEHAQMCSRK